MKPNDYLFTRGGDLVHRYGRFWSVEGVVTVMGVAPLAALS